MEVAVEDLEVIELRAALVVLLLELLAQKPHFRYGRAHLETGFLEDPFFLADDLIIDLISNFSRKRCEEAMFVHWLGYALTRHRCRNIVVGRHDRR